MASAAQKKGASTGSRRPIRPSSRVSTRWGGTGSSVSDIQNGGVGDRERNRASRRGPWARSTRGAPIAPSTALLDVSPRLSGAHLLGRHREFRNTRQSTQREWRVTRHISEQRSTRRWQHAEWRVVRVPGDAGRWRGRLVDSRSRSPRRAVVGESHLVLRSSIHRGVEQSGSSSGS